MRRYEAVTCLIVAITLVTSGLVWLFGPWAMIACGVALGVTVLFVFDLDDDREREK